MHLQVIVSRKNVTNMIKLSPMNTSRGRNEVHSKKMGQFDRVAFKQCGESLFDRLFEFDRKLKETMAYANTQKNGSLEDRVKMETLELETAKVPGGNEKHEVVDHRQSPAMAPYHDLGGAIQINIADDVDDEVLYGKNRHRHKSRGR